ncbi:MAG: DUF2721 domain-containing protein [Sinomicrobium sp.]|nr:DUF2721 domain-containing protein [Candidatus Omnitrophota bacterium]MCA9405994.1 DUF2721 domain-containing protein [Candidatus Omnitrophota bacterium]MCB0375556.1 DUF2721 domain-containing protein [Sinomicrobium sp.]
MGNEIWLTPILILPGVALLIISTANRFGEIQREFHHLLNHPEFHGEIIARFLVKRSRYYRDALVSLYLSVLLFSFASLLGGVINFLFPKVLWLIGTLILLGIFSLSFATIQLLRESRLSLTVIEDQAKQLQGSQEA